MSGIVPGFGQLKPIPTNPHIARAAPPAMLAAKRHIEILRRLDERGTVRTTDLAAEFKVAEETIRRDLDRLHDAGNVVRVHGGARSPDFGKREIHRDERERHFLEEKRAIASAAESLIRDGETLLIDASSSALQLARQLPGQRRNLRVVTYSLVVANLLCNRAELELVVLGGRYDAPSGALVGIQTLDGLGALRIDRAFFSCKGVDLERGISEAREDHAQLKRALLAVSEQRVLLVDHTKFGVRSNFFCGELARVSTLVTDGKTPAETVQQLKGRVGQVIQAP